MVSSDDLVTSTGSLRFQIGSLQGFVFVLYHRNGTNPFMLCKVNIICGRCLFTCVYLSIPVHEYI